MDHHTDIFVRLQVIFVRMVPASTVYIGDVSL